MVEGQLILLEFGYQLKDELKVKIITSANFLSKKKDSKLRKRRVEPWRLVKR